MAAATDQGIVVPLTAISDPFGLKPLTSTILKINTVPQKSLFINITGSLSNIVIPNSTNRPMSASLVVNYATGNPANYSLLAQEVLSSAITSGNLTIPNANVSISITRSFDINDKIIVRVAGNNNSFNTLVLRSYCWTFSFSSESCYNVYCSSYRNAFKTSNICL